MSRIFARSPGPDNPIAPVRTGFASLILRAGLATVFLYHGLEKVLGENHQLGAAWMLELGIQADILEKIEQASYLRLIQLVVAWGEVVGGAALAVGLFTRPAALAMILIQAGATFLAFNYDFFSATKSGGPEYNFVLMAMCAVLLLLGAGRFAVDHWLFKNRQGPTDVKPTPQPTGADLVPADR